MKRVLLLSLLLCFTEVLCAETPSSDLRQRAAAENRPILIYYHGSDWCVSGETALKVWESSELQKSLQEEYLTGTFDIPQEETESVKAANAPVQSLKVPINQFPAMAMYTPQGECFAIWGNIPYNITPKRWQLKVRQISQVWKKALPLKEKALSGSGESAVNSAAEFFQMLIPLSSLGHLRSDRGFKSVWQVMEKQDPDDKTGWRRFFNFSFQRYGNKVSEFRNNNNFTEGEEYIQQEQNDPRNDKLTVEQKQVLELLPFVLYRQDPERREEHIQLLKKVVLMDSTTRWGIGAAGWLKEWGEESPVKLRTLEELMEDMFSPLTERTPGANKALLAKEFSGLRNFSELSPEEILDADEKEFKEVLTSTKSMTARQKLCLLRYRAMTLIGVPTIKTCLEKDGGVVIANMFFNSTNWLESFLESGPIKDPSKAYTLLDTLVYQSYNWPGIMKSKKGPTPWVLSFMGRNIATAIALNTRTNEKISVNLLESFYRLAKMQRLQKASYKYDTREWRFIVLNHPYDNLWINEYVNYLPNNYGGACWLCNYHYYNFFGDTVQGRLYKMPWVGIYSDSEIANRIGGVCGALSTFGSTAAKAHGILSVTGGQPAHCAYMFRATDGRWRLAYNVGPYTGVHFNFYAHRFSDQDLVESIFKNPNNSKAELLYIQAETLKKLRYPTAKLTDLKALAVQCPGRKLPDFSKSEVIEEKSVEGLNINDFEQKDKIAIRWTGSLQILRTGTYTVNLASDDGSRLIINGKTVIDHDGEHGATLKTAELELTKGKHPIEVQYFNAGGGRSISLEISPKQEYSPDINTLYRAALATSPTHYGIHTAYANWMKKTNAPYDVWKKWAASVILGLKDHQESAWSLINTHFLPICMENGGKKETFKYLVLFHKKMRQSETPTAEVFNFRAVLDNQIKLLENDKEIALKLFQVVLDVQFNTPNLFSTTLSWGADQCVQDPVLCQKLGEILNKTFAKHLTEDSEKNSINRALRGMVRTASQKDNLPMFTQISHLMRKLSPVNMENPYPKEDFGGKLLSDKGMLKISTSSGSYDTPELYLSTIDTTRKVGRTFHTNNETSPWAIVTLTGPAEVSGILIAHNSGQNKQRNMPLMVWISEDGTEWTEIFQTEKEQPEWRIDLSDAPIKAKYIKVGRVPEHRKDFFHLGKILIYGKPLY
ncbi:MAG: PA14 domain-containing protein [Planctomycetia bacterium]|nr:PA14 domain-containing protein [Planctomycetia bacterium]